jgi:sugar-specific transcriptional regulator TrmB
MISQVRYQIFVSSTYEDLREERQQATQAILEAGYFPSGMELFPASDDTQWELIKRVIEESDYYVVIVAGRYGSLAPEGLSYTEMEYDYAVEKGIPVLGFVRENIGDIPFDNTEKLERNRKKLDAFRQKVMSRTCRKYSTPAELGMAVMKSLIAETRIRPRTGWVRADQARSEEDVQRERQLNEELKEVREYIEELERKLRDRAILGDEVPQDLLAQGDDILELTVTFLDQNKKPVSESVKLTWDEVFKVIGPSMYGYILRKGKNGYGESPEYPFQDNLKEHIRAKIIDRVQNRKIKIEASQVDSCILQFKEVGLLMFAQNKQEDGHVFRGVTLTELGERRLTLLSTRRREPHTVEVSTPA